MKWISVKDRLPDESESKTLGFVYMDDMGYGYQDVCIWDDFKHHKLIYPAGFGEKFIEFNKMNNEGMNRITHWMPLPEPPEGE